MTTAGEVSEYPLPAGSLPGPIVADDGALWIAERNTNAITRITPFGAVASRFSIPTLNANPLGLLATDDGLWIAEHSASALVHMTREGTFGREIATKSAPDAATLGPDAALWYVSGDDGTVGRLDLGR